MSARDEAATRLHALPADQLETYLLEHSDLPGPRSNLELLAAAADVVASDRLLAWATLSPDEAPSGTALEFLPCCGVVGVGRLIADAAPRTPGKELLGILLDRAGDPRWRVRESVAMALQRWGAADFGPMLAEMRRWASSGDHYRQRAAMAALCEPPLLRDEARAADVVGVLDGITASLAGTPTAERRTDSFRVLRQALGYGWSVAVVAAPAAGRASMERLAGSPDADVRWIVRQNLKKARLTRMDAAWVASMRERVEA